MDLTLNKRDYIPTEDFFGDFPKEEFGISSKFEVGVLFKKSDNFDRVIHDFVFDTGAFISYAPDTILERLNVTPRFEGLVYGIVAKEECKVKTKVARMNFLLIDDNGKESKELQGWFAFHPFKNGPYLLGMKDIIENLGIIKQVKGDHMILQI